MLTLLLCVRRDYSVSLFDNLFFGVRQFNVDRQSRALPCTDNERHWQWMGQVTNLELMSVCLKNVNDELENCKFIDSCKFFNKIWDVSCRTQKFIVSSWNYRSSIKRNFDYSFSTRCRKFYYRFRKASKISNPKTTKLHHLSTGHS